MKTLDYKSLREKITLLDHLLAVGWLELVLIDF